MRYLVLAYYKFVAIEDPALEVKRHLTFFKGRDVTGRIYLSQEGVNGQMSGAEPDVLAYMHWLKDDDRFSDIAFKVHTSDENIFPRMTVKTRKQLVALDTTVDLAKGGEHLSPKRWVEMLESDDPICLLDVRNDYESEIGHFEGAICPPLKQFRHFSEYADSLKKTADPKKTKVMMYCTGGIRCELYSALLKEKGFENVYQLEGGVIAYGASEGSKHWKGKLFVFDDRMAVPIDGQKTEPIATCSFCDTPTDTHYNCAHMSCNALYLSCPSCLAKTRGCCSPSCQSAKHVRPFTPERGNKPFRRRAKGLS